MKKRGIRKILCGMFLVLLGMGALSVQVNAEDYPAYKRKNVYETEKVQYDGPAVVVKTESGTETITKPIRFELYNSTIQETQEIVTSENGKLPELNLIKGHNYILFLQDSEYEMPNAYMWASEELYEIKHKTGYPVLTELVLTEREEPLDAPGSGRRVTNELYVQTGSNLGGDGGVGGIDVEFISDIESLQYTSDDRGMITAKLLEDVVYTVKVEDKTGNYYVKPFPIAVKDKTETGIEYENGKYVYDYRTCDRIWYIQLNRVGSTEIPVRALTSDSQKTSVTGMDFKKLRLLDENLDKSLVNSLDGKDYEVIGLKTVNSFRWEIAKLMYGEFNITRKIEDNKKVGNVYCLEGNNLKRLDFTQSGSTISFTMDTMSVYPVVIEYEGVLQQPKPVKVSKIQITGLSKAIAAGKKIQLTATVSPANAGNKNVTWSVSNKKYAKVTQSGKVTLLKKSAGKKVTVYAAAQDGSGQKASYKIASKKGVVKSIRLSGKKTVKAGKSIKLKAKVNASKGANKKLTWTSSNTKYAKVSSSGKIKTYKAGKGKKVKITARATDGSNKKKTVTVAIK